MQHQFRFSTGTTSIVLPEDGEAESEVNGGAWERSCWELGGEGMNDKDLFCSGRELGKAVRDLMEEGRRGFNMRIDSIALQDKKRMLSTTRMLLVALSSFLYHFINMPRSCHCFIKQYPRDHYPLKQAQAKP